MDKKIDDLASELFDIKNNESNQMAEKIDTKQYLDEETVNSLANEIFNVNSNSCITKYKSTNIEVIDEQATNERNKESS